jgi:hypothetical protein
MRIAFSIFKGISDPEGQTSFEPSSHHVQEDKEFINDDLEDEINDHAPMRKQSIQEMYGDDIQQHTIVRQEGDGANRFLIFRELRELYDYVYSGHASATRHIKTLHEVRLAGKSSKLIFDLDFTSEHFTQLISDPQLSEPLRDFLGSPEHVTTRPNSLPGPVIDDLRSFYATAPTSAYQPYVDAGFHDHYVLGRIMTRHFIRFLSGALRGPYIQLCDSCTITSRKYSVHIIVGAFAQHYYDIAEHAMQLFNEFQKRDPIAALTARFLDMGVYKSLQNFRITGCTKHGQSHDRQKRMQNPLYPDEPFFPGSDNHYKSWLATLFTHIGALDIELPSIFKVSTLNNSRFNLTSKEAITDTDGLPSNFIELLRPHSDGFRVRKLLGNTVFFQRISASHCALCQRRHDSDNTLLVHLTRTAYIVMCNHDYAHRKIIINVHSTIRNVAKPATSNSKNKTIARRTDVLRM